jgi:hypothetical protein
VVVRADPSNSTTLVGTKFEPVTVMVVETDVPAGKTAGEIEETTGVGLSTARLTLEVLPSVPFNTTIDSVPAAAAALAGTAAVNCVALT